MERVCYFHAGCPDGFGAAWAVWRAWGDGARYVPRAHDDALEVRGLEDAFVVFVDIAPPNASLRELAELAGHVVVLDHHLSARDAYREDPALDNLVAREGHRMVFDLEHSGAVLAWENFHPGEPTPELLRYVEDQDLWSWKLPRTEAVNAAIGSYPRDFATWEELARRPWQELADEGEPILRSQRIEVERALHLAHPVALGKLRVEGVNALHHRSHLGHELAKRRAYGHPIGLVYRVCGRRIDASVYSLGEVDVSAIASSYGGGGHRNAAGFSVMLEDWLAHFV